MQQGGKGVFQIQPNGALTPGSVVWTSDDPNVTLTPSADGLTVQASDAATDTATSFNLSVNAVSSNGTALTAKMNVPLVPASAQPPAPASALVIQQIG